MIYPEAVWRPGFNAGYRNGKNRMRLCVGHYTVGRDSAAIGERGYFHFLVRRNGEVVQFAEADSLTWHAGTANAWGPGIEVEYLPGVDDELWTPQQRDATARLCEWLIGLGIPDTFYDGPRIDPSGFTGFLTHRSVQQPDGHSDWWPELPRVTDTPTPEDDDMPVLKPFLIEGRGGVWVYDPQNHTAKPFDSEQTLATWTAIYKITFGENPAYKKSAEYAALLEDAIR